MGLKEIKYVKKRFHKIYIRKISHLYVTMAKKGNENSKTVAILSYILIGLIWYLVDEKARNDFSKFHVKQGLVLLIANIAASIVASILFFISFILLPLISLVTIILVIIGIVNAVNMKKNKLPMIGQWEKYFKF